ncbi:MAG: site-specific recombinase [Cytophagaceae bacterium]
MVIDLLREIQHHTDSDNTLLKALVSKIRPSRKSNWAKAEKNLTEVIEILRENPELASGLRTYFFNLIDKKKIIRLLTEIGILSNDGFFKETTKKITQFVLPPIYHDKDLTKLLNEVFYKRSDYQWVTGIDSKLWQEFFQLMFAKGRDQTNADFLNQLLNSVLVLSQRITSLGLEPEIIDKIPELEEFDSPFLAQNKAVIIYLEKFVQDPNFDRTPANPQANYLFNLLYQCEKYVETIRNNKSKFGASLTLTYTLQRLIQNIRRIRILIKILTENDQLPTLAAVELFKELVKAENKKHSLGEHLASNFDLIAFQITEHAGRTGEHYITSTRKEYKKMFFSAMAGGLIVGILTIFKTLIHYLRLPLFGEAFMYSMNYSLGFMGIHVTHSTLATKQPAMTASKIAGSLDLKESSEPALNSLADLIVKISRSQFIALIGNIIIAFPVAFAIAMAIYYINGQHLADPEKAYKMMKDCSPIESLALFHAAIAGVYLFLAGLISGYWDNKNVYCKISQRLNIHSGLRSVLGQKRLTKFSNYIDKNLGSLAGNFFFGIFLGSTSTIGFIFGLPLDIRHITFSSGNFGIAMAALQFQVPLEDILISIGGILSIGFVNLFVSFGLAIFVAIKSRRVNFRQSRKLAGILLLKVWKRPMDFIYAPKTVIVETEPVIDKTQDPEEVNQVV